jgi:hypothetical protein
MSRFKFAIALSLVASLSSAAVADAPMKFAQAPSTPVSNVDARNDARTDLYAAPVRLDRAAIRAKLAQNRAANLARFRVYQKKGVFPNNTYADGKLNVWLDELGNLCAAATIMKLSGQDDLVQRTADQNNFIRLVDVTQGPLMDWILTSGLTHGEIVAIQEPMMLVTQVPVMEPGPEPILVDARMRRIEDRRLIQKYKQVDARIVKSKNKSLDAATDRLLANPDLALKFLAS